eukprot:Pompholyxophrys_punicea_v1_NODE_89_length_3617_cov_47.365806.p1 type:complete len:429 gc:universal NODE_89_length_3617_cov_47.365806:1173-2459(+)
MDFAALRGQLDALKVLHNAQQQKQSESFTWRSVPLHQAIETDDTVDEALIAEGENINRADAGGLTALHWAVYHGRLNWVIALIARGALVNQSDCWGCSPLYLAAVQGHCAIAEALINAGADVNGRNQWQRTPLIAAAPGSEEMVTLLLAHNAEVNAKDDLQLTALHRACDNTTNDTKIVSLLVDAGAQVNVLDNEQQTPLHWAAKSANPESVTLLLSLGADATLRDKDGLTVYDLAVKRNRTDIVTLLEQSQRQSPGDTPTNHLLLTAPAFLEQDGTLTKENEITDLAQSDSMGPTREALLKRKYSPTSSLTFFSSWSEILRRASGQGELEDVRYCCEALNADIDEQDDNPASLKTALHWAVQNGHKEVVQYLVSKGARTDIPDAKDKTALSYARESKDKKEVLLAALTPSANETSTISTVRTTDLNA